MCSPAARWVRSSCSTLAFGCFPACLFLGRLQGFALPRFPGGGQRGPILFGLLACMLGFLSAFGGLAGDECGAFLAQLLQLFLDVLLQLLSGLADAFARCLQPVPGNVGRVAPFRACTVGGHQ